MAIDTVEGFFTSFHSDPRQIWPYGVDRALSLAANLLRVGIKVANDKIREAANADRARARMGATVVGMAVGEKQVAIAHAGDSRAYRLRGADLKRLTRDHSIAEEMRAARPEMTDEELAGFAHRNVVMRSLGSKDELEPDVYVNRVASGDLYMLCTDGLWGSVPDVKIGAILQSSRRPASFWSTRRTKQADPTTSRCCWCGSVDRSARPRQSGSRLRRPGGRRQDDDRRRRGGARRAAREADAGLHD
jgi:protein phosphatase